MVGGGSFCGDLVVFVLVMDFKEEMLTSPSELAHCGGGPRRYDHDHRFDAFFYPSHKGLGV